MLLCCGLMQSAGDLQLWQISVGEAVKNSGTELAVICQL